MIFQSFSLSIFGGKIISFGNIPTKCSTCIRIPVRRACVSERAPMNVHIKVNQVENVECQYFDLLKLNYSMFSFTYIFALQSRTSPGPENRWCLQFYEHLTLYYCKLRRISPGDLLSNHCNVNRC